MTELVFESPYLLSSQLLLQKSAVSISAAVTITKVQRGYFCSVQFFTIFLLCVFSWRMTPESRNCHTLEERSNLYDAYSCVVLATQSQLQALLQESKQEEGTAGSFLLTLQGQNPGANKIHYPQDTVLITAIKGVQPTVQLNSWIPLSGPALQLFCLLAPLLQSPMHTRSCTVEYH